MPKLNFEDSVDYDVETYPNYFMVGVRDSDGEIANFEAFTDDPDDPVPLSRDDRRKLRRILDSRQRVGFNSLNYDDIMVALAIDGANTAQLKKANDAIILGGMKSWEAYREFGVEAPEGPSIDLIEVAKGDGSLKLYNARCHGKKLQDLPYEPDQILTRRQADEVRDYNANDLDATANVREKLKPQLELRASLSDQYRMDLMSKSDAQIAEAVIVHELEKTLGRKIERPKVTPGTSYRYDPPEFLRFKNPEIAHVFEVIKRTNFVVQDTGSIGLPKTLSDTKIKVFNHEYRLGIGGLHSSEKRAVHISDDEFVFIDHDVTSYYPAIILNNGYAPGHLGQEFLRVYRGIVKRRVNAKDGAKDARDELKTNPGPNRAAELNHIILTLTVEADTLKIVVNGSFGKLGSKWSKLYAPKLLIQTTITGQLSLLMLIDMLWQIGVEAVSANTDGIVIKVPRARRDEVQAVVKRWEKLTGFNMEAAEYAALYSRDVNNYIAVKPDGGVKLKGAYAKSGLEKNPERDICNEAVVSYIVNRVPIERTVRGCTDIRKFISVRTVRGGAYFDGGPRAPDPVLPEGDSRWWMGDLPEDYGKPADLSKSRFLGKAIRWYYSTRRDGCVRNKKGNLVPKTEGCAPCMNLPSKIPDDLNYDWYIAEAYSILRDLGIREQNMRVYKRKAVSILRDMLFWPP